MAVEDVDGNVFLDCAAGIAVNATGHSHPDVVRAITDQAARFLHMSGTDFYYEPQVRVAEALAAIAPMDGPVRVFFGNSGTEAIEACIKLARYATGRINLIAFLGAFHGRTMGALSLTEVPATVLLSPQNPQVLTPMLMTWVHSAHYDPIRKTQ